MASALVASLAAPLHELHAVIGSGVFSGDDPARLLLDASRLLTTVADAGTAAAGQVGGAWTGLAADAATTTISTALRSAADLAARTLSMASRVGAASDAVAQAKAQLQRIVDDFEATAQAMEADLPQSADALAEAARRALADAVGIVTELEAELDGHTAAVTESGAAVMPAAQPPTATSPSGFSPASGWYPQSSTLPSATGVPATLAGLTSGMMTGVAPELDQLNHESLLGRDALGDGVAVRLPDGSTATAPNQVAADAVRHALTQLGVPYDWGGTTPGVGLDCSGLTQWAYHEAGLDLPRLAEDQDLGAEVAPGALLPGDLAVWDGHVAMVVGNGMMIEAGDPVQLSPIRTTNVGQGFQGFWRPTA